MIDWRRSMLFLGVNMVGALALYFGVVETVRDALSGQQREIASLGEKIARGKAASTRYVELASLAPNETLRISKRFLQGDTMGLVSADLLRRVNGLVEQEGGAVSAVTSLPEQEWRGRHLVGMQVDLLATDAATANILSLIETGDCLLFVRRARISPAAPSAQGGPRLLQAKIEVWGATGW
ncbi:MAG: hypothetical protein JWN07_321 [Hyphomicrobiales bacterium]|nr:hypothetical protein [Hyphomicrobiales bacterium]